MSTPLHSHRRAMALGAQMSFRSVCVAAVVALAVPCTHSQTAGPSQAEKVHWQSLVCFGVPLTCNGLEAQGFLFAKPGQGKVVMISHGSQGIDSRMYHYDSGVTELNSGMKPEGDDPSALMARCVSKGFHSGYWSDRFVAFARWLAFFKSRL